MTRVAVLSFLASLPFAALALLSVWTGDPRWGFTALVLLWVLLAVMGVVHIYADEAARRRRRRRP